MARVDGERHKSGKKGPFSFFFALVLKHGVSRKTCPSISRQDLALNNHQPCNRIPKTRCKKGFLQRFVILCYKNILDKRLQRQFCALKRAQTDTTHARETRFQEKAQASWREKCFLVHQFKLWLSLCSSLSFSVF